jgi:uncharacterized protein (DUF934 family)
MPRRLLRDQHIVPDDWGYPGEPEPVRGRIIGLDEWLSDPEVWDPKSRLGVVLKPTHRVELLAPTLARFDLVAAEFSGPTEGRGYTQGRILRERYGFRGELRAVGYVRYDQLFLLARCGFTSFELPEAELATAARAFSTFSAEYQPSNDLGLEQTLARRSLPV